MPTTFSDHCAGCPFENAAHLSPEDRSVRSTPLSMEDNNAPVLLIFQAPGVDEWSSGRPVSSLNPRSAGAKLAAAFHQAGKSRASYNLTNTVQCFPGKPPTSSESRPRDKKPPAAARTHCSNWLRADIESRQFLKIVVFGSEAKKAVKALGLETDARYHYEKHPSGGLSNASLFAAVA
jgi:uracil-DNA glycosylase family 4